jgi:hypothetical protein
MEKPLRRFYVAAVLVTGIAGACSAIASLATHFTDKGDDKYGCTSTTGRTVSLGEPFTNRLCTREMAICNLMNPNLKGTKDAAWSNTACNETVSAIFPMLVERAEIERLADVHVVGGQVAANHTFLECSHCYRIVCPAGEATKVNETFKRGQTLAMSDIHGTRNRIALRPGRRLISCTIDTDMNDFA